MYMGNYMATKIFGESFYKESLIVRCACKQHLVEIFIYDGPEQYEYGIEWLSPYKPIKYKGDQTFYFKDYLQFKEFVDNLHALKESNGEGFFITESIFKNLKNSNLSDGTLKVVIDGDGWIDFIRYPASKRKTKKDNSLWDICLYEKDFDDFLKEIDILLEKATDLEAKKNYI